MNAVKRDSSSESGGIKKEIVEWVKILLAAVVIALVLNTFILANSYVPSGSMENTIMTGDRIMGSRLSYSFGALPQRGDIVFFSHKTEPGRDKTRLVKRVIGLPGETVDIRDRHIYIDLSDIPLDEPYLPEPMEDETYHFEVPEGCYLMLGDNRNNSVDARKWEDPYVPEDAITGKVMFKYFPGIKWIS